MNKKIVIISNYFPPEIGAATNRIKNLADSLIKIHNDVTVICPLPNYPNGKIKKEYKGNLLVKENIDGINVRRYWLFPTNSKKTFVRLLSMISFAFTLWFSFFSILKNKPDIVIVQSPPLLIALSGLLMGKLLTSKVVLNVSDIWPLSAKELGVMNDGMYYRMLEKIEMLNYRLNSSIICQSEEIKKHISALVFNKEIAVYRNCPRLKEYSQKSIDNGFIKIVYAGLLGYAQGIRLICENIDFKSLDIEFHVYGSGMESEFLKSHSIDNSHVFYHGEFKVEEIKKELVKYDFSLIPMKTQIFGAVPSKLFEMMQLGLPVIFFGRGEGRQIVEKYNIGYCVNNSEYNYSCLKNLLLFLKGIDNKKFEILSSNALMIHKNEFNLENQFLKIKDLLLN